MEVVSESVNIHFGTPFGRLNGVADQGKSRLELEWSRTAARPSGFKRRQGEEANS